MKCSFCGRPDEQVAHLVADPEGQSIGGECLMIISKGILETKFDLSKKVECSFCLKYDQKPHGIGIGGQTTICSYCTFSALQAIEENDKSYQEMAEKLGKNMNIEGELIDDYLRGSYET